MKKKIQRIKLQLIVEQTILFIMMVCLMLSISSCEVRLSEKKYKTSKLELRQLVKGENDNSYSRASYFLIAATYSSRKTEDIVINVFAKVEGRYRMIEIPIEDVRISIDNNLIVPNIEVEYYDVIMRTDEDVINRKYSHNIYVINCPEQYLPEKLIPIEF